MNSGIILRALDGSNPLAFLAALGTFRVLHLRFAPERIRMRWVRKDVWRPELTGVDEAEETFSEERFSAILRESIRLPIDDFADLGQNITVAPDIFRTFARRAADTAQPGNRTAADFAA